MRKISWKEFRAGAAEAITGMDRTQQRIKRGRGQLTPINEQSGAAKLCGVLLGEMLLVHELSPLFIVNNLTARAHAASWIAYYGAIASGASSDEAAKLTGCRGKPVTHLVAGSETRHWKDFLTDDLAAALSKRPISIVVDLKALGERLASRAGGLLEDE
jgi:hypothetical protein